MKQKILACGACCVPFVLTGQSDKETTLKSVGAAHRYLDKPCDPEALRKDPRQGLPASRLAAG